MMLRRILVAAALAAGMSVLVAAGRAPDAAFACHPDRAYDTRVNLDRDRTKEEVIAVDHHNCAHTEFRAYVHVRDRCRGAWKTYDLDSEGDVLRAFRLANADGRTKRPEIFFVTSRIGPVARGIAEVVRLDDRASGCASAHALFRYSPADPSLQSFDVELKNVAPQFRGLEVVLTEAKEVAQRVTTYRYDPVRDRYVKYG